MNPIIFGRIPVGWTNNSGASVQWQNNASQNVTWFSSTEIPNNIRIADFLKIVTPGATYLMTTAPSNMTVLAVDANEFQSVGTLLAIGQVQRDIKSTDRKSVV